MTETPRKELEQLPEEGPAEQVPDDTGSPSRSGAAGSDEPDDGG